MHTDAREAVHISASDAASYAATVLAVICRPASCVRPVLPCAGMMGLVLLVAQAMTKKVADRNQAVLYGFAFMQAYQTERRAPQEAAYNLARAAHELNLLHVAVPFYEQALRCVLLLPAGLV